jgi:cytoskeletal protein CcmA (bactofilin family)
MANTKIRLRSSGVTGNIPSSLQFGELALNYADGKLFFKRANNQISSIDLDLVGIQSDSFATINSNSTLILATSPTDTLSIVAGNNVSISTNSSSKTITINALSDDIDQIVRDFANTAASNTVYTQGVDASQNTRINAAFATANVGNSFINSGGTVTGNVTITGTLTVGDDFIIEGNTTYTNTNSLQIDNPIIFLANNNVLGDTFDIGFVGLYNNGANSYTGLFRDPNLDEYFLFRDYTQEVQANTLININDASFIKANLIAGYIKANLISQTATVAGVNILDFLNQISSNTVYNQGVDLHQNNVIQTVFVVANTASANTVYTQGVDAYQNNIISSTTTRLNAAFAAANVGNNFINNGGTINGDVSITEDLTVTGNLTVLGTEVTLNTASIDIDASLLLLANNNTLSDVIDFGFVGTYNDGTVRRAGLFRDPNLKEFLFFDGYTPGVSSNTLINLNDDSFGRANVQADYFKGNLIATSVIVDGTNLSDKLNTLTSDIIHTEVVDAIQNTRLTVIESVNSWQNTKIEQVEIFSAAAFTEANTNASQIATLQNTTQAAFNAANTAASNTVYTRGVDTTQNTRITALETDAGGAYAQANAANNLAQSAFNKANTAAADITVIQGVDTTQNTRIQAAFDKANNASPMLKVASINSSNIYSNIVSNVSTIAFDSFTGFHVYDMGEGNVKISLGSTFSTWNVVGQSDLNAVGDDIIRINGANGIVITTNPSDSPYKSITFNGKTIFDKANSAYNMAEAADILAAKLAEVNLTQNTSIQSSFDKANSANVLAQASFDKANSANVLAQSAFNKANNLNGFLPDSVLVGNTNGYIANSNLRFFDSNNALFAPGDVLSSGYIRSLSSLGDEGGEIFLARPQTNTALGGGITIDAYQNKIRFFEQGGSARGAYIDLTQCVGGAGTNLLAGGGGTLDQYARDTANSASSNTIVIQGVNSSQNTRLDAINNYSFGAYNQANLAYAVASDALAVWSPTQQNAQAAFNKANSANVLAQAAFNQANNANNLSVSAFNQANSVYLPSVTRLNVTNSGASAYLFDQYTGNNPQIFVRAGETLAFNLNVTGHPFLIRVSSGGSSYDTGLTHVSTTGTVTTGSSAQGQVTGTLYWKVPAELAGNTYVYQCQFHGGLVGSIVIERPNEGNVAATLAQASFNTANTKLNSSGGTISGDLTVTGNLFVSGNTSSYTSNNVVINDPIILLANNNFGNSLDIGFVGHYIENDILKHTGLLKDVSANTWYLFDNYGPHLQETNVIDPNEASLKIATLRANLISNSVFISGYDALAYTQAAFDKANTGTSGGVVSLGGFAANNVLTVNSAGYIANNANLNYYTSNNTLLITGNVVGGGIRSTSSATAPLNPVVGDIWYKTTTDVLYRYTSDGTSSYWLDITGPTVRLETGIISSAGVKITDTYIATANQTSFSTSQTYDPNALDVYLNGVKLIKDTDYTANDGSAVVLTRPAYLGSYVQLITWSQPINTISPFLLMGA